MTIARACNARCDADPSIIGCTLTYTLNDPMAVTFTFDHTDGALTPWRFARHLITEVLAYGKAGNVEIGDVLIERRASSVVLYFATTIDGQRGYCKIALPLEEVAIFHAATVGACRPGDEMTGTDIETEIHAWMERGQ